MQSRSYASVIRSCQSAWGIALLGAALVLSTSCSPSVTPEPRSETAVRPPLPVGSYPAAPIPVGSKAPDFTAKGWLNTAPADASVAKPTLTVVDIWAQW